MNRQKLQRYGSGVVAIGCIAFGVTAPAFAEGSHAGHMAKWTNGDRGPTWHDSTLKKDTTETRVVFYVGCSHDFTARIRREKFGPDETEAKERINCTSYTDAVRAGVADRADDYHFDVQEAITNGTSVYYPFLTGNYKEFW